MYIWFLIEIYLLNAYIFTNIACIVSQGERIIVEGKTQHETVSGPFSHVLEN